LALPEELIYIDFTDSRVVLMNEAHNGLQRCIRARQIRQRIIPTAHCPAAMAYSFTRSDELTEQFFKLEHVTGLKTVQFVFLPGSNFDFSWFRFLRDG
jgi:hypothetical protein